MSDFNGNDGTHGHAQNIARFDGKLSLKLDALEGGLLSVDFFSARFLHRVKTTGLKSDLAKACSLKSLFNHTDRIHILDLTAGLGTDAVMLACLGASVTLIEREEAIHHLLSDGLIRASEGVSAEYKKNSAPIMTMVDHIQTAVRERVDLQPRQDSYDFLLHCKEDVYDCIYFDPMFPERKKAAKVKLAMQVFHQVVGFDFEQDARILSLAMEKAKKRVVVKRSKHADFIGGKKPSYSLKLKALRYDIYLV